MSREGGLLLVQQVSDLVSARSGTSREGGLLLVRLLLVLLLLVLVSSSAGAVLDTGGEAGSDDAGTQACAQSMRAHSSALRLIALHTHTHTSLQT
jgi:hypothetical protein